MKRSLQAIFWLGTKELRSFFRDYVFLGFVIFSFSFSVYSQAQSTSQELYHASLGIVDEDHSELSRSIAKSFLPPYFKPPRIISLPDVNRLMDAGSLTFIIDIPPNFQRDVLGGHQPVVQMNIDATAMVQAGLGSGYGQIILTKAIADFVSHTEGVPPLPATLALRLMFNPNGTSSWFMALMAIVNNVTMLAIILSGAAIIREREHGTMEHLLVMPVTPFQIAMAKVWANGLIITAAVAFSLTLIVQLALRVPIAGSIPLFLSGVVVYLFFALAVGIFLGTVARSMPQLGLLYVLVAVPLSLLSGSMTSLESMPPFLRTVMSVSPTTHFVSFAQSILFRGAGLAVVWPEFVEVTIAGALFLAVAVVRFRRIAGQTE